jgi:hypothetical protein
VRINVKNFPEASTGSPFKGERKVKREGKERKGKRGEGRRGEHPQIKFYDCSTALQYDACQHVVACFFDN